MHRLKTQTETQGISKNSPKSASDSELTFLLLLLQQTMGDETLSLFSTEASKCSDILGKKTFVNNKFQQKTQINLWNLKNRMERGKLNTLSTGYDSIHLQIKRIHI